MCPCCQDEAWGPRRAAFGGPPWAWTGPSQTWVGPWAAGPWWRSRPRREDLEEAKRELEEHLAEVNEELSRGSGG